MDNTSDKDKQIEGRNEQIAKQVIVSEAARTPFMDKMSSDGAVQLLVGFIFQVFDLYIKMHRVYAICFMPFF